MGMPSVATSQSAPIRLKKCKLRPRLAWKVKEGIFLTEHEKFFWQKNLTMKFWSAIFQKEIILKSDQEVCRHEYGESNPGEQQLRSFEPKTQYIVKLWIWAAYPSNAKLSFFLHKAKTTIFSLLGERQQIQSIFSLRAVFPIFSIQISVSQEKFFFQATDKIPRMRKRAAARPRQWAV